MLPKSPNASPWNTGKYTLRTLVFMASSHPLCRKERMAQDPCLPAGAQGWKPKFSNAHHFHLCAAPWQHSSDTKFLDPSSGHTRSQPVPSTSESRNDERSKAWRMATENHQKLWVLDVDWSVGVGVLMLTQFQNLPKKPSSLQWGVAGHTMPWCPTGLDQRFVFLLVICVILFWLLRKSATPWRSWFGLSYLLTCPCTGGECPIFRQHPFPLLLWYSIPFYPILSHSIPFYPILSHSIPFYPILSHSIPFYPILSHSILHFQKFIAKFSYCLDAGKSPTGPSFNRASVPASTFGASASVFFLPMVASCPATGARFGRRFG